MFNNSNYEVDSLSESKQTDFRKYVLKTFGMMALGLLITAISSLVFLYSGMIRIVFTIPMFPLILLVAEVGVVIAFSNRLHKASANSARAMFIIYSILTGFTFALLGLMYTGADITLAFGLTCAYFGALVAIGYTTKMDLTRFAPILMTGLLILIVFNVLALFLDMDGMQMIICSFGLLVFTGITAYDAQKMKKMYVQYEGNEDMLQRLSLYSALDLYLDFINIFIYILRIVGNRD